jgi:hypothetical protein
VSAPADILDWLAETECEARRLEPSDLYDKHIVGVAYRFNVGPILAYDMRGVLRANVEMGMTTEEAEEFFSYNTLGSWVGEGTPMFIDASPGEPAGEE